MDASSVITSVVAGGALAAVYWMSPEAAGKGLKATGDIAIDAIPRMLPGFLLAGLALAVVPRDLVVSWMGQESGFRGIVLATVLGSAMPGVTGVQFPIIVAMAKLGVGAGPLMAYLSAWALLGINRLIVWEIPFLGSRLALLRFAVSLFFPLVAGWLCGWAWEAMGNDFKERG
jgi:uncharacterized membrane protein YraQ (UPF0718 family)